MKMAINLPVSTVLLLLICVNNVFFTSADCEAPACREACRDGYVRDDSGCDTCDCIDVCQDSVCDSDSQCLPIQQSCGTSCPRLPTCIPPTCMQMMDSGSCREREDRWFFDSHTMTCDLFQYGGCGGNYNNFQTSEECEETCLNVVNRDIPPVPVCDNSNCSLSCSHGYKTDIQGCDTCECRELPSCSSECHDLDCKYGKVKDEEGCDLCVCNPSPLCPQMTHCNLSCEFGLAKDDNNCDICECYDPCQGVTCASGQSCDQLTTQCLAEFCRPTPTCRQAVCFLEPVTGRCRADFSMWYFNPFTDTCETFSYGGCGGNLNNFETMEDCMSECTGMDIQAGDTGPEPSGCPTIMCDMPFCEFGLQSNEEGCEMCECNEAPVCPVCTIASCEYGMDTDEYGCDICTCRDRPKCPTLDMCAAVTCPFGLATDENGCELCTCNEPCQNTDCDWGEMCDVYINCTSPTTCTYQAVCRQQLCFLPLAVGMCRASIPRWYFNPDNDACQRFDYGGCGSNPNNFETQYECLEACSEGLLGQQLTGCPTFLTCDKSCDQGFQQDEAGCDVCKCRLPDDKQCPDISDCGRACAKSGFVMDSAGCPQCQCNDICEDYNCEAGYHCVEAVRCFSTSCPLKPTCVPRDDSLPSLCVLPDEMGPCSSWMTMWHYDYGSRECQTFLYGGCSGNDNRFNTKEECEQTCGSESGVITTTTSTTKYVCPPVDCPQHCKLGTQKIQDPSGCVVQCSCQCSQLPVQCEFPCPYGYLMDDDGCDLCTCAPPPCPSCPATECPHGHSKGEEGCDVCGQCFNPCQDYHLCGTGKVCVPKEVTCESDGCESDLMLEPTCVQEHKAGRCPHIPTAQHSPDTCTLDAGCPGQSKCCEDQGGYKACTTPDFPLPCVEDAVTGSCNQSDERWYFNKDEGKCDTFLYSGCDGTDNRFLTKAACDVTCGAVYNCPPPDPPLPRCQFGHEQDQNGCPTSVCQTDPCQNLMCLSGQICQHVPTEGCVDPRHCPLTASCVSPVSKVGFCPSSLRWPLTNLCLDMCSEDTQCIGDQKCCDTGCGRICIHPQRKEEGIPQSKCQLQHQKSLVSLHIDSMHPTFVPMCDGHGLYEVIQCNLHLGLCWCVDPVTGGTLAGTHTHGVPDCTVASASLTDSMQVCPSGVPVRRCNPLLCSYVDCPGYRDAICRVNPCGDRCTLEFYDSLGTKIPEEQCQSGMTSCHTEKAMLNQQMSAMMTSQMEYSVHSDTDFNIQYMRLMTYNEIHMMEVYLKRVNDINGPERPDGRPLPAQHMERGVPEEIEVTPGPDGSVRGMPDRTATQPVQGQGPTPYPYIPPRPCQPVAPSNLYIPQCRPVYDHYHGGYQFKQCTSQYCWCVDHENQPIEGTLTDSRGLLTCSQQGRIVPQSSDPVRCSEGLTPVVCRSKVESLCLGMPGVVHRVVDPCNNCTVTMYAEDWRIIQPEECQVPPKSALCSGQTATQCQSWEYDVTEDQCRQVNRESTECVKTEYTLTQQHCSMACEELTCPDGVPSDYMCTDACHNSTCMFFPEAVCMTDICTCTAYFVDPVTNDRVNCNQGTDMCTRYQAVLAQMEMIEEGTMSRQNEQTPCPKKAPYVGDIKSIHLTIKFNNDFSLVALPDKMDYFKSSMRGAMAKMLQIEESQIDVTKVAEGSIITVLEISAVDEDTVNRVDLLEKWVVDGHLTTELGEVFVIDEEEPFSVDYVYPTTTVTTGTHSVTTNGSMEREEGPSFTEGIRGGGIDTFTQSTIGPTASTSTSTTMKTVTRKPDSSLVKSDTTMAPTESLSSSMETSSLKADTSAAKSDTTMKPTERSTIKTTIKHVMPDTSLMKSDTTVKPAISTMETKIKNQEPTTSITLIDAMISSTLTVSLLESTIHKALTTAKTSNTSVGFTERTTMEPHKTSMKSPTSPQTPNSTSIKSDTTKGPGTMTTSTTMKSPTSPHKAESTSIKSDTTKAPDAMITGTSSVTENIHVTSLIDIIHNNTEPDKFRSSTLELIDDIKVSSTPVPENTTKETSIEDGGRGGETTRGPVVTAGQVSGGGLSGSDTAVLVVACLLLAMFIVIIVAVLLKRRRQKKVQKSSGLSSYPGSEYDIMEKEEKASSSGSQQPPGKEELNGISYA